MAIQYISPIKLNLEKNRPNVLLFGNGFFHENMDWKSLLQRCAKDGIENNEFDELIKTDYAYVTLLVVSPESILPQYSANRFR